MCPERDNSEAQIFIKVVENLDRAVIAVDRSGRIVLFNPAAESYTGLSRRQSLDRQFDEIFASQTRMVDLLRQTLAAGRSITDEENISLQQTTGAAMPISVSVSPIYDQSDTPDGAVLIMRDLSRVRELEAALRQADRQSMLGTLAAGLAHEVKNPLGGIRGAAQLLNMELESQSPLREYTTVVIREVERVNGIIEELMDLTRPRPPEMGDADLSRILSDIVLLQKEAGRSRCLEFVLHLDPSIPPIRGDAALLARLFLNLVKNASESVEPGGRIDISTRIASDYHLLSPGRRPVPWVVIEISDNGPGISDRDMERIFTPFFTTKPGGSGLGLATCQKIADSHQGFIKVNSRPGSGCVFSVSLPFIRNDEETPCF
jgi:two-component system nitrogen regulation sensor histidine kinase GlnL